MITDYIDTRTANVYGIYGHLGGGKSLTAVEIALWALRKGYDVRSNIQMFHVEQYGERFKFIDDFSEVDFWQLPCGSPRGSGGNHRSVIIIDECAEFFDQYSGNTPFVKSFLSWLRHSSKRGQFVFLIVQQPEFINKSLRLLINKWIVCVDMYQFRVPIFKVKLPFTGGYVWRRIFDKYGNLLSRGFNFADKEIIGYYYDTAQSIATAGKAFNTDAKYEAPPDKTLVPFLWIMIILQVVSMFYK